VGQQQSYAAGVSFVLLATLGWSLSGIFVRLMPHLDYWQINTWRGFWLAVTLLVYLVWHYGNQTWERFRLIPLFAVLTSAIFFTAGTTLYVGSLTLVETAVVSLIGATSPLFTGLLSPWITGEKPRWPAWVAAALALCGMAVIVWAQLKGGQVLGIILCLGVPITFAGQTLMLRRYRHLDMMPAICLGGMITFLVAGFLGYMTDHAGGGFNVSPRDMPMLAAMGMVQLAIPLIFYGKGARSVPAVTLSLIAMFDAVLNPFWPWLFKNEVPGLPAIVGGGIILVAVLISALLGRAEGKT
jgi:drug/metabolite transporter (DMT)-like permease